MATSTIPRPTPIKETIVQATTADGAINLSSVIGFPQIVGIHARGAYYVAFLVYKDAWYAMVYTWPALQKASNVQIDIVVDYI